MRFFRPMSFFLLLCFVFPLMSNADPLEDANAAIKGADFQKAFTLLSPLAEQNNAEAQTLLGALYVNGQGVEKDFTKGLSWIMKAATKGFQPARIAAFKLCLELGNQGDTTAMYNVGYMCLNGWGGGEYNSGSCLGWLETAGKNGHAKSAKILAKIYTEGMFGVTPDKEKASSWSSLSAAYAAGIDGKWGASVPGVEGAPPMDLSYDFKAEGGTLTGTTVGFGGKKIAIKDGTIDEKNNVSFKVVTNFQGMKSTAEYTGIFLGDTTQLTFTTKMPGTPASPPITVTVNRTE